jgi:hypothetical protein
MVPTPVNLHKLGIMQLEMEHNRSQEPDTAHQKLEVVAVLLQGQRQRSLAQALLIKQIIQAP